MMSENYENDFNGRNIAYYKNQPCDNDILNSMKESLDSFLLNLKSKSHNDNNLSKEELENYYLTNNDIYNSLNVDLISPYQKLVKQKIRKKNMSKRRTYSVESLFPNKNNNLINNNNNLNNNNSFYDKNIDNIKHNYSTIYNESDAVNIIKNKLNFNSSISNNNKNNNKSYINNNSMGNYNNYSMNSNSMKYFQNTKSEFPIKLINNENIINKKGNSNHNKKYKNMLKIPKQNKSQPFNKYKNNKSFGKILRNIKNILTNIKNENNRNKIEIKNICNYFNNFNSQLQNKIEMFIKNYSDKISKLKIENENYKELLEKYKLNEDELYNIAI